MQHSSPAFYKLLIKIKIWKSLKVLYLFLAGSLAFAGFLFILVFSIAQSCGSAFPGSGLLPFLFPAAAIAFVLLFFALIIRGFFLSDRLFTRRLEKNHPDLGTSITGATELEKGAPRGTSDLFAREYVDRAEIRLRSIARVRPGEWRALAMPLGLLLPVLLSLLVFGKMFPLSFRETLGLFTQRENAVVVLPAKPAAEFKKPIIGDIAVKYQFPAYTGLAARIDKNCAGRIRCLKGTSVVVTGKCDQQILEPRVETSSGVKVAVKEEKRMVEFALNVLQPDAYKLFCKDSSGKEYALISDSISCENDEFPMAELTASSGQLTVRKREVIPLGYRATDDFGLRKIRMVVFRREKEEALNVREGGGAREVADQYSLDLAPFALKEGEQGYIVLEAADNDAVSGSKKTRSAAVAFTVLDETRAHVELEQKMSAMVERMLGLLADHLEEGFLLSDNQDRVYMKSSAFDAKSFEVLQAAQDVLLAMGNDSQSSEEIYTALQDFISGFGSAVETRKNIVSRILGRSMENSALLPAENEEMRGLEDFIFFLEEAKEREKVMNTLSMAEDIVKRQKELEEKMKGKEADERLKALYDEFKALQQDLASLFDKLMKDRKESQLPKEFLNADAMKNLPADNISDAMKKIEDALKSGDADKAYSEMMKLRDLMDQMTQTLNSAANEFYDESYSKQMEMMQQSTKELQDLIDRQTRLNTEGDKMMDADGAELQRMMEQISRMKRERIMRMFDKLISDLNAMATAVSKDTKSSPVRGPLNDLLRRTADARNQFASGNDERSADALKENRRSLDNGQKAAASVADSGKTAGSMEQRAMQNEELISMLEHKYPGLEQMMPPSQAGGMGKMANDQGSIMQKLKAMAEGMKAMLEGMGENGQSIGESMKGAASGLGSSYSNLSEYNLPSAMPSAKSGLFYMMRMQEGMKQCMSQMKQGGGKIPMPYGMSFRTGPKGGRAGLATGNIEIGKETGKDTKLKEMIKDAIKEKGPENYDQENKKYYEKLGN